MKTYDLRVLFKQSDIEVLERALSSASRALPLSFYELFYKVIDTKEIDLDELDRMVVFAYSSWNDEELLYHAAKSIYNYISRKFGDEYESDKDYGSIIEGRIYKEGEYKCLSWLDINHERRDGKLQIAIVKCKKEEFKSTRYMTTARLNRIVNYYYGADKIYEIIKQKPKPGRPQVWRVHLKDGRQIRLTKDDLIHMEKING